MTHLTRWSACAAAVISCAGCLESPYTCSGPCVPETIEPLKVGETVSPYHPLLCNGDSVGQRWCKVCENSGRPMVMVFSRQTEGPALDLVRAVDQAVAQRDDLAGIATFLTYEGATCDEAEGQPNHVVSFICDREQTHFERLKQFASQHKIQNISVNLYPAEGPDGYGLSKKQEVSVFFTDATGKVRERMTFPAGEFAAGDVNRVVEKINALYPRSQVLTPAATTPMNK